MFAIHIKSDTSTAIAFDKAERLSIEKELGEDISITWLPPALRGRFDDAAGNSDHSTILIFVMGMAFSSVIKPFVEEVSKEIAKDFWTKVKKLYAKLSHKQKKKTYRVQTAAYLFFELNDEFVALQLPSLNVSEMTEAEIEAIIEMELIKVAKDWDDITADIHQFDVGKLQPGHYDIDTIHVITKRGGEHYRIIKASWEDLHIGE